MKDPNLETAFRSRPFYEHVRGKGLDWMEPLVKDHAFLGKYFPARFVAAYRSVFYGPGRPIQDLDLQNDPGGTFLQRVRARIEAVAGATGRSDNELAAVALCAARELRARQTQHPMSLSDTRAKHRDWILPRVHWDFAETFKEDPTKNSTLIPIRYPETVALYFTAAPQIRKAAVEADAYWQAILDALNAANTGKVHGAFHAADAKARLQEIGSNPLFAKLGPALTAAAERVLRKKDKNLPAPAAFAANVAAAQQGFKSHSTHYTAGWPKLAAKGMPNTRNAIALGLVSVADRGPGADPVEPCHPCRRDGGDTNRRDARGHPDPLRPAARRDPATR